MPQSPKIGPSDSIQADLIFSALLQSLAEGVVFCDSSGTIVFINNRAEELFGYDEGELLGRPLSALLPERHVERHEQHLASFFAHPRLRPMGQGLDLIGRRKDGSEIPVEISLSSLDTAAGRLAVAFITDISWRKATERALQERTEALDAFAHTVAHELNATLAVVVGASELVRDAHKELDPERLHEILEMIARNARKMSDVVNELLLLATLRTEEVEVTSLDMTPIAQEVLERLSPDIQERGATIVVPEGFPMALGYAPWVEEIWFNYVSNALKYGGSPPHVELGGTAQNDGTVRFWVRDNGAGLSPDQQTNLFKPAVRLQARTIAGHGLGLSIVRRIVQKLNGQVGVESEIGRGSVFSFTLPL
jgi:PAS domain S-box-containing protein